MRLLLALFLVPAVSWAGNIQLPSVSLAAETTQPAVLFSPAFLPVLQARRTNPNYRDHYAILKGLVDGQLSGLKANPAGLGDDTLSKVALGAALLQQLGETPAAQFSTYRDAAVVALKAIVTRNPSTIFGGTNAINVLQDSPRLQSMAEAYDLLRGTGVSSGDDAAIRSLIGTWAEAMRNDYNIAGAIGIPGHRDNWGIKGGASLITVALVLSNDSRAGTWLQTGQQYTNESLAAVASDTGWWRESPHYLNYTLNNLVRTAWHVRNRSGVDWFPALRPLAETALGMRQPNGLSTPFEEGVSDVFPYDVMADRYPDLAGPLQWAWAHSSRDASAFENQALQSVTRFILNSEVAEQAPSLPSTRFMGSDAHIHVLRSSWEPDALQATMITARDHSSSTLYASRHNMQNPLDLTIFGAGQLLLPTSSGGPQVTTSANRNYYLPPSARNGLLIAGTAPFITDDSKITSDSRLDGAFLDVARTNVTAYSGASRVSRLMATVGDRAVVLVDEAIASSGNVELAVPFHGRGTYSATSNAASRAQVRWDFRDASLDLWTASERNLTLATNAGYYADVWGQEESLMALQVKQSASAPRIISLLVPRLSASSALQVQAPAGQTGFLVMDGAIEELITTGPTALLGVLRKEEGALKHFALASGTRLDLDGVPLVSAPGPVTLEGELGGGGIELRTTIDAAQSFTLSNIPGVDATHIGYVCKLNDTPCGTIFAQADGQVRFTAVPPGAHIRLEPGHAPTLDEVGSREVPEGELLSVQLSGHDEDGQTLTFSMTASPPLPAGAVLNPSTGLFQWTPSFAVAQRDMPAVYEVTIAVSDGFERNATTVQLSVINVNRPPELGIVGNQTVTQGETLIVALVATDPDGDPLTWSCLLSPDVGPCRVEGNTFSWSPTSSVAPGNYSAEITASDGLADAADSFSITVSRLNHPPIFTTLNGGPIPAAGASLSGMAGVPLTLHLAAQDPDGDVLSFSISGPAGLTIDAVTGEVAWPNPIGGTFETTADVSDAFGGRATLPITLQIANSDADGGVVEADGGNAAADGGNAETDGGGEAAVDAGPTKNASVPSGCGCGHASGDALGLAVLLMGLLRSRRRPQD